MPRRHDATLRQNSELHASKTERPGNTNCRRIDRDGCRAVLDFLAASGGNLAATRRDASTFSMATPEYELRSRQHEMRTRQHDVRPTHHEM